MAMIFINGEFIAEENAKISVLDRGFLFADGVYEVIPIFSGRMLCVDDHLNRLESSLAAIHMKMPFSAAEFKNIFHELLIQNNQTKNDLNIYVQITRGADTIRNHAISSKLAPTVVAFCTPTKSFPQKINNQGFCAIILEDTRHRDCYIKSTSLLANILLYEQARQAGALDAILTRDGEVTEGTTSNVFIVKENQILTPPCSKQILNGVTRQIILNIAKTKQIPYQEKPIPVALLKEADEIWLTGSTKEICPVTLLDKQPVGDGQIGPIWHQIMHFYEQEKNNHPIESQDTITKLEPSHD